jgi:hypothetical protein
MRMEKPSFEDTVKNLLKMPPKPHQPAKGEDDGGKEPETKKK